MENESLKEFKEEQKEKLKERVKSKILEQENADFLIRLLEKAESKTEVLKISALGMTYKRTGFHFDVRLEKMGQTIKYLEKNEKLSFYQGGLKHKLIIGDNYPALLNLLISYKKKVKVIYIDPPYGKDDLGEFAKTNYDNAITRDNLLSMLYPRLSLAKQLLRDDGVIFCSIDDRNQAYVKGLFDEVFGEGNFVGDFIRKTKSTTNDSKTGLNYQHEFLLCYAKDKENVNLLGGEKDLSGYKNPDNDPNGAWVVGNPTKSGYAKIQNFPIKNPYTGFTESPPNGRSWVFTEKTFQSYVDSGRLKFKKEHKEGERIFIYKHYLKDLKTTLRTFNSLKFTDNAYMNQVATKELLALGLVDVFKYPKGVEFIKEIIRHATTSPEVEESEIILDFFAGSGTTAHAVMQLNREDGGKRQCILVTNNEKTELNPNGIAFDVTSKRLKRIMSGECYDGTKNFQWLEKNAPYGDSLEVSEIVSLASSDYSVFEKIDEKLYEKDFKGNTAEKIEWICKEFELTCKKIEGEE